MTACIESGERAPTLTLPRKREREPTGVAEQYSLTPDLSSLNGTSTRQAPLPLPLAGEGRGGGAAAGANFGKRQGAARIAP
jgi:hypothetical protein